MSRFQVKLQSGEIYFFFTEDGQDILDVLAEINASTRDPWVTCYEGQGLPVYVRASNIRWFRALEDDETAGSPKE